jgi:hypothetical protein
MGQDLGRIFVHSSFRSFPRKRESSGFLLGPRFRVDERREALDSDLTVGRSIKNLSRFLNSAAFARFDSASAPPNA